MAADKIEIITIESIQVGADAASKKSISPGNVERSRDWRVQVIRRISRPGGHPGYPAPRRKVPPRQHQQDTFETLKVGIFFQRTRRHPWSAWQRDKYSCLGESARSSVVDVDEPAAAFADQILKSGVNLSIDKTFVQRLGHRIFVCRRLQGFTRSAKKLFAQSYSGSASKSMPLIVLNRLVSASFKPCRRRR